MNPMLPPTSNDIYLLLALVSDPDAARARLNEIKEATEKLNESINASREAEESARRDRLAAAQSLQVLEKERTSLEADKEKHKAFIVASTREIEDKLNNASLTLSQTTQKLKAASDLEYSFNIKLSKLNSMEDKLKEREASIQPKEQAAEVKKREYETLLSKFKNLVS